MFQNFHDIAMKIEKACRDQNITSLLCFSVNSVVWAKAQNVWVILFLSLGWFMTSGHEEACAYVTRLIYTMLWASFTP